MMKHLTSVLVFLLFLGCKNYGQLTVLADLPKSLKEVSGTEIVAKSNLIWMVNDGGNKPKLFGLNATGNIIKTITIKAKNNDWEDLASDEFGNIYIADFGNNTNKRKNLTILIVAKDQLKKKKASVKKITFKYPNQDKFPPKNKQLFFDAEALFYFNNALYLFTKSNVKNKYGITTLYKLPAKQGNYTAERIGQFNNGTKKENRITSADISLDGKKVVLLTTNSIVLFSNFKNDNFLSGHVSKIPLLHNSQKESITFKDNSTVLLTDEKASGKGGYLYELKL